MQPIYNRDSRPRFPVKPRAQAGMVIVAVMLVLMLLLALLLLGTTVGAGRTGGAFDTGNNGLRGAAIRQRSALAFNAAESGVTLTLQWLTTGNGKVPPSNKTGFRPLISFGTLDTTSTAQSRTIVTIPTINGALDSDCLLYIYPGATNQNSELKQYLIESIGRSGNQTYTVQVFVQQNTFGRYAFFENSWGGGAWNSTDRSYDGPVHINNVNWNQTTTVNGVTKNANIVGLNWRDNPPENAPIFAGPDSVFTTSSPQIKWYHNGTGPADNTQSLTDAVAQIPKADADWKKIATNGKDAVQWDQPIIPVPENNDIQRYAVLGYYGLEGASAPATVATAETTVTSKGIGIQLLNDSGANGGGVYINGDVKQMTLAANQPLTVALNGVATTSPKIQTITVSQQNGGNVRTSVLTINPITNTTTLTWTEVNSSNVLVGTGVPVVKTGTTNGVVYVNGNIGDQSTGLGGLKGVVADNMVSNGSITKRNALTIATATGKSVSMNGDLVYLTQRIVNTNAADLTDAYGDKIPPYIPEKDDPNFVLNAGTLGVVAYNIKVSDRTSDCTIAGAANKNAYTDTSGSVTIPAAQQLRKVKTQAACFALNTYDVFGLNRNIGTDRHQNMGCYLHVNGGSTNNMKMVRLYDNRLSNDPPPYFPTTGTRYQVLSWRRMAQRLEP